MNNLDFAKHILQDLHKQGVTTLVICPGARCAPLLKMAQELNKFKIFSFFDERSASFFALGKSKQQNSPVAVITTSGSAVANCLPAIVEAKYASIPLVIISADRPKLARGTGAPQTMEQPGLFGEYSAKTLDFDLTDFISGEVMVSIAKDHPSHINLCFDEPLLGEAKANEPSTIEMTSDSNALFEKFLKSSRKPVFVLGPLLKNEATVVADALKNFSAPIYCEALSQLQGYFGNFELTQTHLHLAKDFATGDFDSVIRIGQVPCLRFWRDLENSSIPVISFSESEYSGLARLPQKPLPIQLLPHFLSAIGKDGFKVSDEIFKKDQVRSKKLFELIEKYPNSELSQIARIKNLSKQMRSVFIGNSLVIREWDTARLDSKNSDSGSMYEVVGQRGLNGIDGLISHALGHIQNPGDHLIVLGDLSALYDLNSLWALKHLPNGVRIVVAVINNGGGKIFKPIFKDPIFENSHNMNFESWANLFNARYALGIENLKLDKDKSHIVCEIRPDEASSHEINSQLGSII